MKKKMPLIIMAVVLGLCIAGYFGIKDMEWEDTSNPNATTVDNMQTISEAIEAAEEEEIANEADISEDVAVEAD